MGSSSIERAASGRSAYLDAARGVAALSVFVYHLFALNIIPRPAGRLFSVPEVGALGVELFFVLSGYFITTAILRPEHWDPVEFWRARVSRIYPAYLASMVLILTGKLVLTDFHFDLVQICVVLLHLVMLHNFIPGVGGAIDGTYWTMGVEFPYYFIMLALAPFLRARRNFLIITLLMVMITLLWRASIHILFSDRDAGLLWFANSQIVGFLDMFAFGGLVSYLRKNYLIPRKIIKYNLILFLISFASLAILLNYYISHSGDYWVHWQTSMLFKSALAANFALIVFFLTFMEPNRWLRWSALPWFGRISFSFYLYHFPFIALAQGMIPDAPWPAKFIFITVVTTAVSWISWRFVEIRFHRFMPQTDGGYRPAMS